MENEKKEQELEALKLEREKGQEDSTTSIVRKNTSTHRETPNERQISEMKEKERTERQREELTKRPRASTSDRLRNQGYLPQRNGNGDEGSPSSSSSTKKKNKRQSHAKEK